MKKIHNHETPIYTISQMWLGPKKILRDDGTVALIKDHLDHRVIGYTHKLSEATEVVVNNYGDLWEAGYYPYALIEEVYPGIYNHGRNEYWFKFAKKTRRYLRCKKPACLNDVVGFSMG